MSFEDDLRHALRREPAPPDFAAKVLARAARANARPAVIPFWRQPVVLAIAAVLVLVAILPPAVHEYRRQKRGIEAKDQLIEALSITRAKLQHTKEKVLQNARRK